MLKKKRRIVALSALLLGVAPSVALAGERPRESVRAAQVRLGLEPGTPTPLRGAAIVPTVGGQLGLGVVGAVPAKDGSSMVGGATVLADRVGSGVRASVVVPDASAPTSYKFEVAGATRLDRQDDGSVLVYRNGLVVGQVHQPWAVDATGQALSTSFAVSGTTLVQRLDDPSQVRAYPVVMDPDLAPGCVTYRWTNWLHVTVEVRNGCSTRQRVKVVVAFWPDSPCVQLERGGTFKADIGTGRLDRLERC
jgi:hypothetical protein